MRRLDEYSLLELYKLCNKYGEDCESCPCGENDGGCCVETATGKIPCEFRLGVMRMDRLERDVVDLFDANSIRKEGGTILLCRDTKEIVGLVNCNLFSWMAPGEVVDL